MHGLVLSLFLGGLAGSLSHCTAMCGPLALGQAGAVPPTTGAAARLLLPYHAGRITTYMMLALVFGWIVNVIAVFALPKLLISAVLLSLASLMFFVTAIPFLSAMFPWVARLTLPVPRGPLARASRSLMINPAGWRGYALGVVLGFLPCGLSVSALMAASTATGPVQAALVMAAFGVGTVPALMAVTCGGGWLRRRWPVQVRAASGLVMTLNGVFLLWLAAHMVI